MAVKDKTDYTSRKTPPGVFVQALQKFLPALEERDLRWSYSGIRPCVIAADGHKSDFVIAVDCEEPPLIKVGNGHELACHFPIPVPVTASGPPAATT